MPAISSGHHHRFGGVHAIGGERHDGDTLRLWFERLARVLPNLHLKINNIWVKGPPWHIGGGQRAYHGAGAGEPQDIGQQ